MRYDDSKRASLSAAYPHARIDTPVDIGHATDIWQAHVMREALIGDNCTIGDGVHVGRAVQIGDRCKLQNGAQLFEGVTLEDDVFIGPCAVFTNVLTPRAHVNRRTEFKPTFVMKGATIGANATILCGITIGAYAMIGAGAVVTRDVPGHSIMVGNPADHHGWACVCGVGLQFSAVDETGPISRVAEYACPRCASRYVPAPGDTLKLVEPQAGAAKAP